MVLNGAKAVRENNRSPYSFADCPNMGESMKRRLDDEQKSTGG
jgi:hypothetical protein